MRKRTEMSRSSGLMWMSLARSFTARKRSELTSRICVLLGGIAAEDLIYQESSTGAQNDLQRATDIARRMVTEFGMSSKLGRVHYSDVQRSPFLMNAMTAVEHAHSEQTAREIDMEVKKIIDECSQTAAEVLVVNELGARVLEQLDGQRPVSAIVEALAADYDVERPTLARDVSEFLEDLAQSQVVVSSGS